MQKIDDCKEIRLALTRAGIATRPEKLQTFRLVVTAQYIYHTMSSHRDIYILQCQEMITRCQRGVDTEAD
jgi:hypothetical protein